MIEKKMFKTCGHCSSSVSIDSEFCPYCFYDVFDKEIAPIKATEEAVLYEKTSEWRALIVLFSGSTNKHIRNYIEKRPYDNYETFNIKGKNLIDIIKSKNLNHSCDKCLSPLQINGYCAICGSTHDFNTKVKKIYIAYSPSQRVITNWHSKSDMDEPPEYSTIASKVISSEKEMFVGDYFYAKNHSYTISEVCVVYISENDEDAFLEAINIKPTNDLEIIRKKEY